MQFKWHKTGLIELIFLLAALIWIFFRYHETLNLLHPEWIILGLGLGFLWCLRHKLYLPLFLLLFIAGTLLHQWFVVLPNSLKWLQEEISAEEAIMVNGKILEMKRISTRPPSAATYLEVNLPCTRQIRQEKR